MVGSRAPTQHPRELETGLTRNIMKTLRFSMCALALVTTVIAAPALPADTTRPVRIIVPFLGGELFDGVARIVIKKLGVSAGLPFVIENHPGDGSHFAAELVAKAQPDGYTLLFAPIAHYAVAASLPAKLHYDLLADFTPVTLIANAPHVLVAHPSLPVKSVAAVTAVVKAGPGQIKWASHGKTSLSHLELEMFRSLSGIKISSTPLSDSGAALRELLVGNVDLLFDGITATLPHIKAGRLRAIAVAGSKRSPALRELPTVAEGGIRGFEADYWYGILAPEGVDMSAIGRLNDDFSKAVNAGDVRESLMSYGIETRSSTPAQLATIMRDEVAKWAKVIKASEINSE
jgi:tripartite-type tricarboxylate transporter receptor subunit TctC